MGLLLRITAILLLLVGFIMNIMLEGSENTFPAYVVGAFGVVFGLGAMAHSFFVQKNVQTTARNRKSFGLAIKFGLAAAASYGTAMYLGLSFISLPLVMLSVVFGIVATVCLVSVFFTSS